MESLTHVRIVVDHTHCPSNYYYYYYLLLLQRLYNDYTIAKISKAKYLALILLISVFILSSLHVLSKKHLKQLFCYTFYSQPFNEMFIASSKSRCCNVTFTNVLLTSLRTTNRTYLTKLRKDK